MKSASARTSRKSSMATSRSRVPASAPTRDCAPSTTSARRRSPSARRWAATTASAAARTATSSPSCRNWITPPSTRPSKSWPPGSGTSSATRTAARGPAVRKWASGSGSWTPTRSPMSSSAPSCSPPGWDALLKHLRGRGFTDPELRLTGMFSEGNRGIYDRFRGRLIWPIRDIAGDTIGFGARKLYEDDQGPKYLNTPETVLYKKSQVLYGIDLAKRKIAKDRQRVVVEGYTDVMACHLAGIPTAAATCGTAFAADHIKIARRLLSDDGTGGEVIFTFDGDAAGQKAALRAFEEDQRFVAQTYVAVEPNGADPCDLRLSRGDDAVHALIQSRRPLF